MNATIGPAQGRKAVTRTAFKTAMSLARRTRMNFVA
jgi:hypothetical protein